MLHSFMRTSSFNASIDLDSLSSAIGFAWYLATIEQTPAVPLLHTPRSDLHLRAENLHALELSGIPSSDPPLLCVDDVPTKGAFPSTKFALVDHNRLHGHLSDQNPEARVVAVIDHHEDEGLYKDTANPRIITVPTGSASSLVALYLQEKCADRIPQELATLLLCSVLIDTGGLKVGGKAVDSDRTAAAFLTSKSLLQVDSSFLVTSQPHDHIAVQTLSSTLSEKKGSVSHLNTSDLLRRDYKEYTMTPSWAKDKTVKIGLASVPVGLKPWIQRDAAFWASTESWLAERNLAALGVLTSFRSEKKLNKHGKPKHKREQLFVIRKGEDAELATKLFEGLEASQELKLKGKGLKKLSGSGEGKTFSETVDARAWKQGNVDATRKITAPVVKTIIEGSS